MLGTISTVAAIALAHNVVPPITKDEGWNLLAMSPSIFADNRTLTDQLIFIDAANLPATATSPYSASTYAGNKIDSLMAELASYGDFQAGWDGEGSAPPNLTHIDAAFQILNLLPPGLPLPTPMLSADGEVGFYWNTNEYLADAVIEDTDQFSLFIRSLKDGNEEIYIPAIVIGAHAREVIADAFRAV